MIHIELAKFVQSIDFQFIWLTEFVQSITLFEVFVVSNSYRTNSAYSTYRMSSAIPPSCPEHYVWSAAAKNRCKKDERKQATNCHKSKKNLIQNDHKSLKWPLWDNSASKTLAKMHPRSFRDTRTEKDRNLGSLAALRPPNGEQFWVIVGLNTTAAEIGASRERTVWKRLPSWRGQHL